ncbi:MAG TPA: alkaline phosphatase family protein [Candidatus Babeliales bacterium]|nr:alkaline phosphatase family protein [Candidatus Babeliales bacterium]
MNARCLASAWAVGVALALGGCGGGTTPPVTDASQELTLARSAKSPIEHVVLIVQENRSFDNFFATFPGADGATRGKAKVREGSGYVDEWVTLAPHALLMSQDIAHCHSSFETAFDGGKMDGFNLVPVTSCNKSGEPNGTLAYQYVVESDIEPYWDMAEQWVLADHMFQTQGSGSFTAHQDLIRGDTCIQSCAVPSKTTESLVDSPDGWPWGCDAFPKTIKTWTIDLQGIVQENGPFPCSDKFPNYGSSPGYDTIRDLLDAKGVSWKYYTPCFSGYSKSCSPSNGCPDCSGDLLNAFDVIYPVRYGPEWGTAVSMPETNIFHDISKGALPAVSWVIPSDQDSDHPAQKPDDGPSWVASVVNAVGKSSYWKSSVIIVLWDDWGGFYDNVAPHQFPGVHGGLGFRVPAIVISPYDVKGTSSKGGYVAHTEFEFGSILRFIEGNWKLGSLGTTDQRAANIGDYVLNYKQKPRSFSAIPSRYSARYFLSRPQTPQYGDQE